MKYDYKLYPSSPYFSHKKSTYRCKCSACPAECLYQQIQLLRIAWRLISGLLEIFVECRCQCLETAVMQDGLAAFEKLLVLLDVTSHLFIESAEMIS